MCSTAASILGTISTVQLRSPYSLASFSALESEMYFDADSDSVRVWKTIGQEDVPGGPECQMVRQLGARVDLNIGLLQGFANLRNRTMQ